MPLARAFLASSKAGCGAKVSADLAPREEGEALPEEVKTVADQGTQGGSFTFSDPCKG